MPFDGPLPTSTPNLATLSAVLRDKGLWPDGFVWGYNDYETCALGLASRLWTQIPSSHFFISVTCGIDLRDAENIFINLAGRHNRGDRRIAGKNRFILMHDITPTDVADAIDEYLAGVVTDGLAAEGDDHRARAAAAAGFGALAAEIAFAFSPLRQATRLPVPNVPTNRAWKIASLCLARNQVWSRPAPPSPHRGRRTEMQTDDIIPLRLGTLVRFANERKGGPVHRVVSVMSDGMIELQDMGGYFAPHLFCVADDIGDIPPARASTVPHLVNLEGDDIVIRITPDALRFASEHGVLASFSKLKNDFRTVRVFDMQAWRKEVLAALRREEENGDTPVHLMLDDCLEWAVEQGAEGISIEDILP